MVSDNNRRQLSDTLLNEIQTAINRAGDYGSVEIIIQDSNVTQISSRSIRKTKVNLVYQTNGSGNKQKLVSRNSSNI